MAISGIAQFSDIAGPVVRHQPAQGFRRQRRWRTVVALGGLEQEFVVERRDVLAPLAQGRQFDAHDVEPVVEVSAELALIGQLLEILLGRCNDTAGDGNLLIRAQTFDDPLLQNAQQLDLHRHRHRLDFVEEERAALGEFDLADATLLGAGEGAGLVAEQLAVEQRLGHATAVEGNVIVLAGVAEVMQAAGDHFLAGTGLAHDQHIDGGAGDIENQLADPRHLRRAADQARFEIVAVIEPAAQRFDFEHQRAFFQRTADDLDQIGGRKRLLHEVVGAVAHRLDRQRHIAVAGNDDHRQIGVEGIDAFEQRHAIGAGQAHVGDDDAGKIRPQQALGLLGAGNAGDRDASELHRLLATEADIEIVFDEQDLERRNHDRLSLGGSGRRMTKRAPPPGAGPASRSPPKSRRMSREMVSPRPRPSPCCLVVKKGSKR